MLKLLEIHDVGPAPEMRLEFGERLNIVTGDNGLGKSFILDIVWWALTRNWVGRQAAPQPGHERKPSISFSFDGKAGAAKYTSTFDRMNQLWTNRKGRPWNPGLVIYGRVDGGFSVWDPARNYWRTLAGKETPDRPSAYHFAQDDIWNGLTIDGKPVCSGLIRDWTGWQLAGAAEFDLLAKVLLALSPSEDERMQPGRPAKIDIDDARMVPTVLMPYGDEVPIVHISAGMRRIIALAYILVWAWQEHLRAAEFLGADTARQVIFLVDEIEAHLHPKWQRVILKAALDVVGELGAGKAAKVQMIASTHSPIVLTSLEPMFDDERDAWFDIDIVARQGGRFVELSKRAFTRQGTVSNWLTSDAFHLPTDRPKEVEPVLERVSEAMSDPTTPLTVLSALPLCSRAPRESAITVLPVDPKPEPATFDAKVRQKGLAWIARRQLDIALPAPAGTKFPPHWQACSNELWEAYAGICSYSCLYIHRITGASTVDHFAPKSRAVGLAYEWTNYRLACALINSRKRDFEDVLDPFEIGEGVFLLDLITGRIVVNPEKSRSTRANAEATIERLRLNDGAFVAS